MQVCFPWRRAWSRRAWLAGSVAGSASIRRRSLSDLLVFLENCQELSSQEGKRLIRRSSQEDHVSCAE